jgi:hypothetical protein
MYGWPRLFVAVSLSMSSKVKVRLTRKLAECIDGVDLSSRRVGDVVSLSPSEARLLVAEGWATPEHPGSAPEPPSTEAPRVTDPIDRSRGGSGRPYPRVPGADSAGE